MTSEAEIADVVLSAIVKIEALRTERNALRAALDVARRWHDAIAKRDGCDGCELSAALATAKEADHET